MNVDVIPLDSMNHIDRPDHHYWREMAQVGDPMYTLSKEHHHAVVIIPSAPTVEDSMHQFSLFAAEPPASHFLSPDSEKDWMMRVATLCSPLDIFLRSTAQPGSYGRTSQAYCRATKDETLQAFWDSSRDRSSSLQRTAGETPEPSQGSTVPTVSRGVCLTLNTREVPTIHGLSLNDEGVCSLSDILETGDVPQRYYLTPKACRGILRRAEKRGKELPALLKAALEAVANRGGVTHETSPTIKASSVGFSRTGNGRGQDPVIAVYENHPQDSRITELGGVCSTVHSKYGTGGGNVPLVAHSLSGEGFDASEDGTGRGTPIIAARMTAFGEYEIDGTASCVQARDYKDATDLVAFTCKDSGQDAGDISPTLRSMNFDGSHANGGGQLAVAFNITPSNSNKDYNAREARYAQALTGASGSGPSARGGDQIASTMAVRRLLPVECEKLQGFPEGHTNVPYRGKDGAPDGPRYKAIGNSFAVNVIEWIGLRIAEIEK